MTLRFTVVGEPRPKGSLSHGRHGRAYWPKRVMDWQNLVAHEARLAMAKCGFPLMEAPVSVTATFYVVPTKGGKSPGRLRGDLDKLERAIFDAMTGVVYRDDEQVYWGHPKKVAVEPGRLPRAEISVHLPVLT